VQEGNLQVDEIKLVKEDMRRAGERGPFVVPGNRAEGVVPVLPVAVLLVHGQHLLRIKEEGISRTGIGVSRGAMVWGAGPLCMGEALTLESLGWPEAGHRRPRTSSDGHGRCIVGDDRAAWCWTPSRQVSLYVLAGLRLEAPACYGVGRR
jgi:hypothetical protein